MRQSLDEGRWAKRIFEGPPQSRPFIQITFLARISTCNDFIDAAVRRVAPQCFRDMHISNVARLAVRSRDSA
jgi:hypothetical protein